MARCAVPARESGRNEPEAMEVGRGSYGRLTLRSATGTAQRAIPASLPLRFTSQASIKLMATVWI